MLTAHLPTVCVLVAATNCAQNSWHTLVKTLPSPNFVCGRKQQYFLHFIFLDLSQVLIRWVIRLSFILPVDLDFIYIRYNQWKGYWPGFSPQPQKYGTNSYTRGNSYSPYLQSHSKGYVQCHSQGYIQGHASETPISGFSDHPRRNLKKKTVRNLFQKLRHLILQVKLILV